MTTFLLQCLVCLLVWMGVGITLALKVRQSIAPAPPAARGKRALTAIWLYLLSALVLLGGLFGVLHQRGIQNNALVPWAWFMVGLIGLVFVLLQLRATVLVGSLVLKAPSAPEEKPTDSPTES